MERRKYLDKGYKNYFKTFNTKIFRIEDEEIKGFVSYLYINKVNYPLIVVEDGKELCLADNGYSAINYLPDNEKWKLLAMYDSHGKIIEWYFDINKKNDIDDEGNPYCDDLYLDLVLTPKGKIIILDEDELKNAYDTKSITKEEFDLAYKVKDDLINNGITKVDYVEALINRLLKYMNIEKIKNEKVQKLVL